MQYCVARVSIVRPRAGVERKAVGAGRWEEQKAGAGDKQELALQHVHSIDSNI